MLLDGLTKLVLYTLSLHRFDLYKPIFSQSSYKFEIPDVESTYVGMEVGRVKATDQDTGPYGAIMYTLLNDSYYFSEWLR